jgi:glycine/D-amino acid oxidase-like deaminating enzyme
VYFHSEAQYILSGYADPREKTGYSFEYDAESFFQEKIWTPLFERSSKFEMIKHITGWAGLYEESIDKMPILGAVNPQFFNNHLFEAHSFSGRGLMQSYEAGRILSSMILNLKEYDPQFEKLSSARFYSSQGDSGFTEMMII